jgi:quinol monooxygenase YgiN
MTPIVTTCVVGITLALCGSVVAQTAFGPKEIYVVSHIDIAPQKALGTSIEEFIIAVGDATRDAAILLQQLAVSCHKDTNCRTFEVLQQIDSPNHFTVLQHWTTAAAFEAHEAGNDVRQIRAKLQPILGSPFDERVDHRVF